MRLTQTQRAAIVSGVHDFMGTDVNVHMFGARLDDTQRGGDVDLLLMAPAVIPRLTCTELKRARDEHRQLPLDILTCVPETAPTPFRSIAQAKSPPINTEKTA